MLVVKQRNVKKIENKKDKRFSLKETVWIGFNYTCGMAFPLAFGSLIYGSAEAKGIGLYFFLILLLGSALAAGMAYAYSKMARFYVKSNGATYAYVRSSFGRFYGWIIGSLQYITVPMATVTMILSMISINLKTFVNWGSYTELYLNLIGLGIYLIASISIFFGIRYFKLFINLSGIIKWISTAFIIVTAIALSGLDNFSGFKTAVTKTSEIDYDHFFSNFNQAFVSMFYFYAGFEVYSTIAKNVKNPSKTLPKSILIITMLTLIFYVITTIFFIGINSEGKTLPNGDPMPSWFSDNPALDIARWTSGTLGIVLVISSMISLKLNAAMQSSLYSSAMLEPLAAEHYITPKFSRLNKDKIATTSVVFNIIFTSILTLLLICLPSLFTSGQPDYSDLVGFATIIIFLQYISVLASMFKLYLSKKIILAKWEIILFIINMIFLIFEFVMYFINEFQKIIITFNAISNNSSEPAEEISGIFSLISVIIFIFLIMLSILVYNIYYLPIYKKRMINNPELQEKLNNNFKISGYAKLEKEMFYKKNNNLKEIKEKFKNDLKQLSNSERQNEKLEFKTKKLEYLVDFKEKVINLKKEYKNNIKEIGKNNEHFEKINKFHSKYLEDYNSLVIQKNNDLQYLRLNIIKINSVKNDYFNSKNKLLTEIEIELENFIISADDFEKEDQI